MSDLPADLAGEHLADEAIELRLIRFLPVGELSKRDDASAFLAQAPEYRFAIHRRTDGVRVGRIHVRITDHPEIVPVLGHLGFAVDGSIDGKDMRPARFGSLPWWQGS